MKPQLALKTIVRAPSRGFTRRYVCRHIIRAGVKSALSALLALLLFVAVGYLAALVQSYKALADSTIIKATLIDGLELRQMRAIADSGYVSGVYYAAIEREVLLINISSAAMAVTNDLARYTGGEVSVAYADGYDESCLDRFGRIFIVGSAFAQQCGIEPGDEVSVTDWQQYLMWYGSFIDQHRRAHPDDGSGDDEIYQIYEEQIIENLKNDTYTYTVAGVVETFSEAYDSKIYTPGTYASPAIMNALDYAEYIVGDNSLTDEFRSYIAGTILPKAPGVKMAMDTSKLENIMNSRRMIDMLYPMAVAAALLMSAGLCCLLILQVSRESAIMRALGTTRGRTRALLVLEQAMLSAAGLLMGAGAMYAAKGAGLAASSRQLCAFGGMYAATVLVCGVICSWLATRRSALDLLQAKE